MENNVLDLKRQIDLANKLIECADGNIEVIELANKMIKGCEKAISIEQNMNNYEQ